MHCTMKVLDLIKYAELVHCHIHSFLTLNSVTLGRPQFYFVVYMKCPKSGPKKNVSYCRTWAGLTILKIALEH